jgi:predicted transcriptional regulator
MEVHFSPDVETRLQQVAVANGKDAEQLVKDSVARMLENQARFISGVHRGIEQADRGEFVEHQEVRNRIDRLFPREADSVDDRSVTTCEVTVSTVPARPPSRDSSHRPT